MKTIKGVVTVALPIILLVVYIAQGQQFSAPPEAYKACEGKSKGSAAQFVGPRGSTVSGICEEVNGKFALQPNNNNDSRLSPPPEAYKACEGKNKGSAALFVGSRGGTVNGICEDVDGKLVLQPNGLQGTSQETTAPGAHFGQSYQRKEVSPRRIELPVGSSKVYVTRSVPNAESERGLTDKDFKAEAVYAEGGKVLLTLDGIPVFVEEQEPTTRAEANPDKSPFGFHPAYTYKSKMDRSKLREPSDIGYDYSAPTDMGVTWHRPEYYALWDKIQKNDSDISAGKFDWKEMDYVYGSVPNGMRIMGNIGGIARRTEKGENSFPRVYTFKSEFYEKSFSTFVKKLVERYDGDGVDDMPGLKNPVKYWQVENEPDFKSRDWKGYAKLVAVAGKAMKDACADCKVVMGGVESTRSQQSLERFYVPVIKELKGKYIDVFDFHFFFLAGAWEGYKGSYDAIRKVLNTNGFAETDIWMTETGTYSGSPKALPVQSESQQAADVVKRYVTALSLGIKKVFWAFGIMEGFGCNDCEFDHTGFVYNDNVKNISAVPTKKLAYYTYKLMTEKLAGSDFKDIKRIELGTGVYGYKFVNSERTIYVVWAN